MESAAAKVICARPSATSFAQVEPGVAPTHVTFVNPAFLQADTSLTQAVKKAKQRRVNALQLLFETDNARCLEQLSYSRIVLDVHSCTMSVIYFNYLF